MKLGRTLPNLPNDVTACLVDDGQGQPGANIAGNVPRGRQLPGPACPPNLNVHAGGQRPLRAAARLAKYGYKYTV